MTQWELVIAARENQVARNRLLTLYDRPILEFYRKLTGNLAVAEELSQSFFLAELTRLASEGEHGVVRRADPGKGLFRNFLMAALRRHWLSSFRDKWKKMVPLPADIEDWESRLGSAEKAFHRAWVRRTLVVALREVEAICAAKRQEKHFKVFMAYFLPADDVEPTWEELAERFCLADASMASNRAATVKAHLKRVLGSSLLSDHAGSGVSEEVEAIISILGDDDA